MTDSEGVSPPSSGLLLAGRTARRDQLPVLGTERIGPYTLVRLERGELEPGIPGQFFMLEAPGRVLPRPMSLCHAPPGELAFLIDPIGPGTRALCELHAGQAIHVLGPLGNGFDLDVERPLLVAGGIGIAPMPFLSEALGHPPAVLGFRTAHHAEAARLLPSAEIVVEPQLVTDLIPNDAGDVLACGPEPMLELIRARVPRAQLAWEAPMACGYGACYGCVVEIDGHYRRLCVDGPVLRGGTHGSPTGPLLDRSAPITVREALAGRSPASPKERRSQLGAGEARIPILNASGCLDALTAPGVARQLDAFVTKTVTPLPREGNPPSRIAETDAGMLNSIGLQNPGLDAFAAESLPRLAELGVPLWVSVGGFSARDYAAICERLDAEESVVVFELNLSCPNVEEAPETAAELVGAARRVTTKPVYAKLSPATWDVAESARTVADAGADGLSLVNTIRGLALDVRTRRPMLARGAGGYSGPALRPIALACVHACAEAVDLPIVGMGGVASGGDAYDLVSAGASALALGTVLFCDPTAPCRIRAELESVETYSLMPSGREIHGFRRDSGFRHVASAG